MNKGSVPRPDSRAVPVETAEAKEITLKSMTGDLIRELEGCDKTLDEHIRAGMQIRSLLFTEANQEDYHHGKARSPSEYDAQRVSVEDNLRMIQAWTVDIRRKQRELLALLSKIHQRISGVTPWYKGSGEGDD